MPKHAEPPEHAQPHGTRGEDADEHAEQPGLRAFWSGTISFGLVSIPVDLFAGTRSQQPRLRLLGPEGTPLKRTYQCPQDEAPVPPEDMVRGYPVTPEQFVVVSDDELDALAPEKTRDIDLTRFVDRHEIDVMLLDRTYYLLPATESTKAYRLLADTMERMRVAGIASFVMRGKAYVIAIYAEQGVLHAETLRFADELRTPERVGLPPPIDVEPARVQRLEKQMRPLLSDQVPIEELEDRYRQHLLELVEAKRARSQDVVHLPEVTGEAADDAASTGPAPVIDLLQLLKSRLQVEPKPEPEPKPRSRRANRGTAQASHPSNA